MTTLIPGRGSIQPVSSHQQRYTCAPGLAGNEYIPSVLLSLLRERLVATLRDPRSALTLSKRCNKSSQPYEVRVLVEVQL
ncbi:hypothetical protein JOB18_015409 [Solea senegalensis]|uniref:Uncharacterized protein n=1 Tax=Solea senegalensis TaxID=28829 RepID=A0AAV6Q1G5_SOLSE|nr:hypothetical protein JOB18_015409 [Solea senegalensis]